MKKLAFAAIVAVSAGCSRNADSPLMYNPENVENGKMSVSVMFDDALTRSVTDYVEALDSEKKVNSVTVLVFDEASERLQASKELNSITDTCQMSLPVGQRIVYAVVNGPELSGITRLSQLSSCVDDLKSGDMGQRGLTLIGNGRHTVVAGESSQMPPIPVRWLVARVVLNSVACNIPSQYGEMTVESVFLGNAMTSRTFFGASDNRVNPDGYANRDGELEPVGLNGWLGECNTYLYREVGETVAVEGACEKKYHMYCQPDVVSGTTSMYILVSIGGVKYYYRVPLDKGLEANSTSSVDVVITNLGSETPPSDDLQKGQLTATVTFAGWTAGNSYSAEF